jgi:hypothetical protein
VRAGLKKKLGAWAGDVVEVLGVRARWSAVVCEEGGSDRGTMAQRERGRVRSEWFVELMGGARYVGRGWGTREGERR